MKMIKIVSSFMLILAFASCSSDSGGSSSDEASMSVNGTNVVLSSPIVQRGEDTFVMTADLPNDESLQIEFNKYGNLGEFSYWQEFEVFKTYEHYKSNYFTFNLISVNENTRRVKVSFSGTLYADENDLNSDTRQVSGTFDLPYLVTTPLLTGLGLKCKIGSNDWYETSFWDNGFGNIDRKFISDDEYQIIMQFVDEDISTGTYTFTTSSMNKMQLAKFNTTTLSYTEYNTTGTVTVTSNSFPLFGIRVIEGTFSLTATNPSNSADVIQVTNGSFKTNL